MELIANMNKGQELQNQYATQLESRMSKNWVNALFERFTTIYQNKWADQFMGDEASIERSKTEWAQALANVSGIEIKGAIALTRERHTWPPSIAEFMVLIKEVRSNVNRLEREGIELAERERLAALPAPTHQVNAVEELAKAKKTSGRTHEETLEMLAKHEELIAQHKRLGHIRTAIRHVNTKCAVNHCHKAGAFTSSQKGSDNWFCGSHYKSV